MRFLQACGYQSQAACHGRQPCPYRTRTGPQPGCSRVVAGHQIAPYERSIFGHQFAIGLKSRDFVADRFLPAGVPNLGVNSLLGGFGCQPCLGTGDLQCLGSRYFAFEPKNEIRSSRGVVRRPEDLVLVLFKGLDPGTDICSMIGRIMRNANFGGNKDACQFGPQFFFCVIEVAETVRVVRVERSGATGVRSNAQVRGAPCRSNRAHP